MLASRDGRDLFGQRIKLSDEGMRLVGSSQQYNRHGPNPQEWRGTIVQQKRNSAFRVQWDHLRAAYYWHPKYVEIIDDCPEALVPRVQSGRTQTSSAPSERVRAE